MRGLHTNLHLDLHLHTNLHLDERLNLTAMPAFLRAVQPFERLWWRPLVASVMIVVFGTVFALIGNLIGSLINWSLVRLMVLRWPLNLVELVRDGPKPCNDCLMSGVSDTVLLGAVSTGFLIAVLVCASAVDRRPFNTFITAAVRFRWRLFLAGLILFATMLGIATAIPEALHGWPDRPMFWKAGETPQVRLLYIAVTLLALPVAAAFEEVLCRGWLLQTTAAFTRNLPIILLFNSLIFAGLHLDGDLGRNLSRAVLGAALSYGVLRLGGLEFAIGIHAANNLIILLLAQTLPEAEKMAPSTALGVAENIAVTIGAVMLIELTARWAPLRRWAGLAPYPVE